MAKTASNLDSGLAAELDLKVAEICRSVEVTDGIAPLIEAIQAVLPDLSVRHAMTRSGWHRLGGVVDLDGNRIAHNITEWAEAESEGDIDELMFKLSDVQYFATRLNGQTHYLVAQTGPRARDYIQIEIEQLQEVLDRCISDPDWFPDSIADFVDPVDFPRLEPEPVGSPRLLFRRLVRVSDLMDSQDAGSHLMRFLDEWDRSSAAESEGFCRHWVLSIREYQDRDGDGHLTAKPVPVVANPLPVLSDSQVARGSGLANQIHGFDREAGYPFAWYFHMLTNRKVSHKLAEAVHADLMGAYDYLPARDLKVLRDWYQDPYGL
ncbi:hypothetical protein ThidrDRAFT_2898 [Thiorhodococcus drewsii AZ1]|uniref:Uncharacterized protein n=1 Tax=Thiorhodococcus drewsii AZ1 TaxID=765913 RepID=G2E3N5_9GAMM|nr:hypothetical protein [Thiorhodococcus drewsii]EGV30148.1 hypothetical protein ThidrDRAFT_2898 [Thiorhodococcus drewsii AZ1]